MNSFNLRVNGKKYAVEAEPDTPLLWIIRDELGLTGTKFSCGIAQCGACTLHLNGNPVRSCMVPVSAAVDSEILTIEGLSDNNDHPVQQAWIEEQVPQCGYCHSGQIMAAAALLKNHPEPTDEHIYSAMRGVLCRCGTYPRIKRAIRTASKTISKS
jgi:aerobic-type carbon monoxide dehydrogenase small subunit (CoxS/CutS family)